MSVKTARWIMAIVLILSLFALTWPALLLVNRVEPRVLGLPFHMAWIAGWIVLTFVAMVLLERTETRAEDEQSALGETS